METLLFDYIDDKSLLNIILLIIQVFIIVFVIIYIKSYVERLIAWHYFKKNLIAGLGTKISFEAAKKSFTGVITNANFKTITVTNHNEIVPVDTRIFMNMIIIIHKTNGEDL